MPIICVWIPAFRLAVARLTHGHDYGCPSTEPVLSVAEGLGVTNGFDGLVIVADKLERGRVVDCSLPAAALGVRPGMTLVQAQAMANEARTVVDLSLIHISEPT